MKISRSIIVMAAYAALILWVHLFDVGGQYRQGIIYALLVITPLIPVVAGYVSSRYFGFGSAQGKSIFFMALAMLLAWIGKIIWTLDQQDLLSFGHLFFLALRPVFAIAIFFSMKVLDDDLIHNWKKLASFGLAFAVLAAVYFTIFPVSWHNESGPMENIILISYGIMDLFLLAFGLFTIYLLIYVISGKYSMPILFLCLGTISFWVSQIYFLSFHETYSPGNAIDLGWYFGYLFFAMKFLLLKHDAEAATDKMKNMLERKTRVRDA